MSSYQKLERIGSGTYGIVFKGIEIKTNCAVAVKSIRIENCEEGPPPTTLREISLLKQLNHQNIVHLMDIITHNDNIDLIFEYLDYDLKKFLDSIPQGKFISSELLRHYLVQIVNGVEYCHSRGCIHRDLKPQNILISTKGVIKICDFGLARTFRYPVRVYTHEVVTLWYRAPELLLGSRIYAYGIDIWSLGCIFVEMITRKPIFPGDSEINMLIRMFKMLGTPNLDTWPDVTVLRNYNALFPYYTPGELRRSLTNICDDGFELLKKMLIYDPLKRIKAKEILEDKYFQKL